MRNVKGAGARPGLSGSRSGGTSGAGGFPGVVISPATRWPPQPQRCPVLRVLSAFIVPSVSRSGLPYGPTGQAIRNLLNCGVPGGRYTATRGQSRACPQAIVNDSKRSMSILENQPLPVGVTFWRAFWKVRPLLHCARRGMAGNVEGARAPGRGDDSGVQVSGHRAVEEATWGSSPTYSPT